MRKEKSTMKTVSLALVAAMLLSSTVVSVPAIAKEPVKGKETARAEASEFLLISPHTAEECLAALDAIEAQGTEALAKWHWGCMAGDHTGYAMVRANSDQEALKMVPESVRPKALAMKLTQFTAEQIKSFHEMH